MLDENDEKEPAAAPEQSKEDRVRAFLDSVASRPKNEVEHALFQALLVLFPEPAEENAE